MCVERRGDCSNSTAVIDVADDDTDMYAVGHKKRATLLWTITSTFLGFQHFVHQWKEE